MKIFALIAAGLLGLTATAPAVAVAAPVTTVAAAAVAPVQERVIVRERTTTRRYDDRRIDNRQFRRGNRWGSRQVCTNRWRNHRKIRTCRSVRYRR